MQEPAREAPVKPMELCVSRHFPPPLCRWMPPAWYGVWVVQLTPFAFVGGRRSI